MTKPEIHISALIDQNERLRGAIARAEDVLRDASRTMQHVLEDEALVDATPVEVETAMSNAVDQIASATQYLQDAESPKPTNSGKGGPTRRQGQFLAFIREYMLRNRGVAPSHGDIQQYFRLTPPSVNSMLKRLDQEGYIKRVPGKARAIELSIDPDLIPPLE